MERQSGALSNIRADHITRYEFAKNYLGPLDTLLDAGCGVGYGSFILSDTVKHVDCVDISTSAHDDFLKYYAKSNVNFMCEDIFKAHYRNQYDAIVCFEFLEHIDNPSQLVQMFAEKTDVLISSVPNELITPHNPKNNPYHKRHFTPDQYHKLLEDVGFFVDQMYNQKMGSRPEFRDGPSGKFMITVALK